MSEIRTTRAEAGHASDPDAPLMRSPVSRLHGELGARFELEAGWEIPSSYGDPDKERALLLEQVAVADVTARGKIDLRGRLDAAVALATGAELLARISDQWALLLAPPGPVGGRVGELEARVGSAAMVTDATHLLAGFVLAGPRLGDALARLTGWDPSTLAPKEAAGAPIAQVRAVILRRDLELPAIEVYVATEFARFVWRTILGVVQGLGGGPAGWTALREQGWL